MISFVRKNFYEGSFLEVDYSKVLNYIFIIYAFSTPFMKAFNRPVALIMLLVWILEGNFKRKIELALKSKVFLAFSAFVAFNYISILWSSAEFSAVLSYVNRYFAYFAFVVIFTSIKKEFIPYLISSFILAMFVSEIVTYGIYFDWWTTTYNIKRPTPSPTAFMGHTGYSLFLSLVVMMLINKIMYEKTYLKYIYIAFCLTAFANLMVSGGRQGIVTFVITFFVFSLFAYKYKVKQLILVCITFIVLFFIGYKTIDLFQHRVDKSINSIKILLEAPRYFGKKNESTNIQKKSHNKETSWTIRAALAIIGFEVFKEAPIIGHGIYDNIKKRVEIASLEENKEYSFLKTWAPTAHYHNVYIEIATQLGIIGLFLFLMIFYTLAKTTIRDPEFFRYKVIFITVMMSGIISSLAIQHRAPMAIFALLIAIILSQNRIENEEKG